MNHWNPILYENRNLVPASTDPNYYLTTDLADKAIAWVRKVKSIAPDQPFFLYVAPGATHSPHHAPKEWIDKFKGKFDMGWDQYREETFARQKKLGVVPPDTKLTKRSEGLPAWDSLNADQKRLYARMMEVFAGYGRKCRSRDGPRHRRRQAAAGRRQHDLHLHRRRQRRQRRGRPRRARSTRTCSSTASRRSGRTNLKVIDELGGPKHFNHFPSAWAHAMNTPFQWTKQVASHFGGTRNPMIVSWPGEDQGQGRTARSVPARHRHRADALRGDRHHARRPTLNGVQQKPIEGISFAYTFDDAKAKGRRTTQYFEMGVNRGIYHDGWMASALSFPPWQSDPRRVRPRQAEVGALQHRRGLLARPTTSRRQNPEKLRQLQDLWWVEAAKYNVLPLDWRGVERLELRSDGPAEPDRRAHEASTYFPGKVALPRGVRRAMLNKSWTITADIEVPDGGQGHDRHRRAASTAATASTCATGSRRSFTTTSALDRPTFAAKDPLPKGKVKLVVDFAYDGRWTAGKGGDRHDDGQRQQGRRRAAGKDHPAPVLARRRTRHRHGRRLGGGLHLQAAVHVHGHDREGRDRPRPDKVRAGTENNHATSKTHPRFRPDSPGFSGVRPLTGHNDNSCNELHMNNGVRSTWPAFTSGTREGGKPRDKSLATLSHTRVDQPDLIPMLTKRNLHKRRESAQVKMADTPGPKWHGVGSRRLPRRRDVVPDTPGV